MTKRNKGIKLVPIMRPLLPGEFNTKNDGLSGRLLGKCYESIVESYLLFNGINFMVCAIDEGIDYIIPGSIKNMIRIQVKGCYCNKRYQAKNRRKWKGVKNEQIPDDEKEYSYVFNFKIQNKSKTLTIHDVDVFYHVFKTEYRTIIWKTDAKDIAHDENGVFVEKVQQCLLSEAYSQEKKKNNKSNFRNNIVFHEYKEEQNTNNQIITIENFLDNYNELV